MDLRAYLMERMPLVERALDAAVPPVDAEPQELHAAMRHLLLPGGKRLRPALALAAAEAVGAPSAAAVPGAVAVELIHTYSLIHDDLPCMDDDAERRGKPSVHVAFGEATAVLAGDALQTAAFAALLEADGPAEVLLHAARDLARAAGSIRLVGGQVADLRFDPAVADAAAIESVHLRKSAALIAAAITIGARLAGAGEAALARLRRAGEQAGVAFQIADDLLDEGEDDGCSLLRVMSPEAAKERAGELLASALSELSPFGARAEALDRLLRFCVWRTE